MDLKRLRERKKELNYTNEMISELSGVPLGTVQKVFSGATASPRYSTLVAIEQALYPDKYFYPKIGFGDEAAMYVHDSHPMYVKEEAIDYYAPKDSPNTWPRQGEYTLDDYYALPDDTRVELIDGRIYDMTAPTIKHQDIIVKLVIILNSCIVHHNSDCKVLVSPVDVRLDRDDKTMVEPDIVVICKKPEDIRRIEGAPEFVCEVLSPSTRSKDCLLKTKKYSEAGVKEYWIIDPENEKVLVYAFENDPFPQTYSFSDVIPLAISNGKCEIDFSDIKKELDEYYS